MTPWLPPPPADFRARCAAAETVQACDLVALRRLAETDVDLNQATRLSRSVERALDRGDALGPLRRRRLGLLADAATDLVVGAAPGVALRRGLALSVAAAPFGQIAQATAVGSDLLDWSALDGVLLSYDERAVDWSGGADAAWSTVERHIAGLRAHGVRSIFVENLAGPDDPLCGGLDRRPGVGRRAAVDAFNRRLAALSDDDVILFDVAALAEGVGLARWRDPARWHAGRFGFAPHYAPVYADALARLVAAECGLSRKCLVLDLDDTLWAGALADDGVDALRCGPGDPVGEAHRALQIYARALKARGVLLALCSKNDRSAVLDALATHPDMLLRAEDFAMIAANFEPKSANLRAIAEALNFRLDALVFVDNDPAERFEVRMGAPDVATLETPVDPADVVRALASAGYFETIRVTDEDRRRSELYAAEAQRTIAREATPDIEIFLSALDMRMTMTPLDRAGRFRFAQLVNKSNQCNLTGARITEAALDAVMTDPKQRAYQVRLTDRFGDQGVVAALICSCERDVWRIDVSVMSCRVLNRRLEEAVLNRIADDARAAGAQTLVGVYTPTGRNARAAEHYAKLGFAPDDETAQRGLWRLSLSDHDRAVPPIAVLNADAKTAS